MFIMSLLSKVRALGWLKGSTRFRVDSGVCLYGICFPKNEAYGWLTKSTRFRVDNGVCLL
jgi:hypothetical protein